jgi:hypothetical protein
MRFFVLIFCTRSNLNKPKNKALSISNFILEFADILNFVSFGGDSDDTEPHSPSTESM